MSKYFLMTFFLLASCQSQVGTNAILEKQDAQIHLFQKDLKKAEEDLDQAASNLAQIQTQLHIVQLAQIQTRIRSFQNHLQALRINPQKYKKFLSKTLSKLFLKERETLNVMITTSLDESFSFRAQKVLDQILDLITTLREQHEDL